jgi:hypothetical protein
MAAPAPLTVRLPPLHEEEEAREEAGDLVPQGPCHPRAEEAGPPVYGFLAPATLLMPICEMCGSRYEDRHDGEPYCSYHCATGGGSRAPEDEAACAHECPADIGGCLDPDHCECACADCAYYRLPLCHACGYRDEDATSGLCPPCASHHNCDHCGDPVAVAGLCNRCLRNFQEEERWYREICEGCSLTNAACRCHEDEDHDHEERPTGRRCPVCRTRFEGNEWYGVCSRACARPSGWG